MNNIGYDGQIELTEDDWIEADESRIDRDDDGEDDYPEDDYDPEYLCHSCQVRDAVTAGLCGACITSY